MGNEQSTGHALGPLAPGPLHAVAKPLVAGKAEDEDALAPAGSEAAKPAPPPWWAPLSESVGLSSIHRSTFDFNPFSNAAPPLFSRSAAATAVPTPAEQASLVAATEDELQSCVREAQSAAEARAEAEAAALAQQLEALEASRKEIEAELSAARKEAEQADKGDSDGTQAKQRVRTLQARAESNAAAKCACTCRQVFKAADGFTAAFGSGNVLLGFGEVCDDSLEGSADLEATPGEAGEGPMVRVRVAAPGPRGPGGEAPRGGARAVVRLSKLGVRGEGLGVLNVDAEAIKLDIEFTLGFSFRFDPRTRLWAPCGGVQLDLQRLDQKVHGCLVMADSGLPLLEMPADLLRLVLNLLLPKSLEQGLRAALPPQLGDYLALRGAAPLALRASLASRGAPFAVLDANMCDAKAPAAAAARALAGLHGVAEAEALAGALIDWCAGSGLQLATDASAGASSGSASAPPRAATCSWACPRVRRAWSAGACRWATCSATASARPPGAPPRSAPSGSCGTARWRGARPPRRPPPPSPPPSASAPRCAPRG